jgi:transposase
LDAVAELDLDAFYGAYRRDGWGAAAHDPQMMVALFVYAYSIGVRSARGIERRCRDDVAFRVITGNQVPDHATIARFRVRHEDAIADLFGGVLELCAKAGLVSVGIVAVDGTKIAAAATHHATRSYEQIAKEILEEAAEIDAAEDELYGEARGDELPEGLRSSGDRRQRLREAKQALDAERAARARPIPRDRCERLAEGKRRLEEEWELERRVIARHEAWRARGIAKDGSRRMTGHNRKPYPLPPAPAGKVNVTDPDSRNLKTTRGWVQGYNAQAVVTPEQIVSRRRSAPNRSTLPICNRWSRPREPSSKRPGSRRSPGWCWPTPAAGRTTPSKRSSARASRPWSPPTPTAEKNPGPAGVAASTTSHAECSQRTGAKSSTSRDRARSNPSSGRSRQTATPTASYAAADRPSGPNGGY